MSELKLITPRRNFLVRALGFTAAGATLPVGIIAVEDARSRIEYHRTQLEKAWSDYYGADAIRSYADIRPPEATYTSHGGHWQFTSSFALWGGSHPEWCLESHAWKMAQPFIGDGGTA